MSPKTLQAILGHKDIGVTMNLYCHPKDKTVEEEFRNVHIRKGTGSRKKGKSKDSEADDKAV